MSSVISYAQSLKLFLDQSFSSVPEIMWLHLGADLGMALICFSSAVLLISFLIRRQDLKKRRPFVYFSLFFILTGTLFAVHLAAPWYRTYVLEGILKAVTVIFSLAALYFLRNRVPAALRLPSPDQVARTVLDMERRTEVLKQELRTREISQKALEKNLKETQEISLQQKALIEESAKEMALRTQTLSVCQKLFDHSEGLLAILDKSGRILEIKGPVGTILGYPAGCLTGTRAFELVNPENRLEVWHFISEGASPSSHSGPVTFQVRHANGSWKWLKASGWNYLDSDPMPCILVSAVDVTREREFEIQLNGIPALLDEITAKSDFHEALQTTVQRICEANDWKYGEAWLPLSDGRVHECSVSWFASERFEEFRRMSKGMRLPTHLGTAGKIFASRTPQWIHPISQSDDSAFLRIQMAKEAGFQAALAVPVLDEGQVIAILLFFSENFESGDLRMLDVVHLLGLQLGLILRRKLAEEAVRDANQQVEKRIREKTEELHDENQELNKRVTDLTRTETELRQSQENFLTLVHSIDGIVWEYDLAKEQFSFVSQQAERILGLPVTSWYETPRIWEDHIHGQDREAAVAFRERIALEKNPDQFEYRMITADGKTLWLRDMVSVVEESGRAIKLRGVMVNITEAKQVEEALNQERNFVTTVLDTASAIVMILDPEGRIVRFNRSCEKISGYLLTDVQNKPAWDLFLGDADKVRVKNIYARLLAGQYPINYESTWIARDGTQRVIAWSDTVLVNRYGTVLNVISTGIDITESKEVEQKLKEAVADLARSNWDLDKFSRELKNANDRLRKMDELKSHFISAASHELRTPLTSIKGYVETILGKEAGPINEKQHEFLGYVKESTDRLHRLLNELLDISKIESGQVQMQKELLSLRELLQEELLIFKGQADKKNLTLKLETDVHMKEIYADSDKVRELVANLLSNAIKYTASGGNIRVLARNRENGLQVDIEDNGIGIRDADLVKVFEPFQHIEKNGFEDTESAGLGLTLAKRIVEAHDGQIWVNSKEGRGSVFSVFLPTGTPSPSNRQTPWVITQ